jgi:Glyoxalase-like domain
MFAQPLLASGRLRQPRSRLCTAHAHSCHSSLMESDIDIDDCTHLWLLWLPFAMLQLDHITVVAPCLEEGVAHVRACLDLDIPFGRRRDYMGTHNHLMRLGEAVYFEIVALDSAGQRPSYARWFGLDDQKAVRAAWDGGHRLRAWVVRTRDIDAVLAGNEACLGRKVELTTKNSSFYFSIPADGSRPFGGAAPSVNDRRGKPPSVAAMADFGAKLRSLTLGG